MPPFRVGTPSKMAVHSTMWAMFGDRIVRHHAKSNAERTHAHAVIAGSSGGASSSPSGAGVFADVLSWSSVASDLFEDISQFVVEEQFSKVVVFKDMWWMFFQKSEVLAVSSSGFQGRLSHAGGRVPWLMSNVGCCRMSARPLQ